MDLVGCERKYHVIWLIVGSHLCPVPLFGNYAVAHSIVAYCINHFIELSKLHTSVR